jgi:hypothetical protein
MALPLKVDNKSRCRKWQHPLKRSMAGFASAAAAAALVQLVQTLCRCWLSSWARSGSSCTLEVFLELLRRAGVKQVPVQQQPASMTCARKVTRYRKAGARSINTTELVKSFLCCLALSRAANKEVVTGRCHTVKRVAWLPDTQEITSLLPKHAKDQASLALVKTLGWVKRPKITDYCRRTYFTQQVATCST